MATKESIALKIRKLINSGNAVTGKADEDLTAVFSSLIEGYGVGECNGKHIIEVEELPTENIDNDSIYKIETFFSEIVVFVDSVPVLACEFLTQEVGCTWEFYTVYEKPTVTDRVVNLNTYHIPLYYVKSENDIFCYVEDAGWMPFVMLLDITDLAFGGVITNPNQATSENCYYALYGDAQYFRYANSSWRELITPAGSVELAEMGEYDVTHVATAIVKVSVPTVSVVQTLDELPTDAVDGSLAFILGGE